MSQKRNWMSLGLLVFFLLSLAAALLLHRQVLVLEVEQADLHSLDPAKIYENMGRNMEITRLLHGGGSRYRGLYGYRIRAAACAFLSGFFCFCDGIDRLRRRVYRD